MIDFRTQFFLINLSFPLHPNRLYGDIFSFIKSLIYCTRHAMLAPMAKDMTMVSLYLQSTDPSLGLFRKIPEDLSLRVTVSGAYYVKHI